VNKLIFSSVKNLENFDFEKLSKELGIEAEHPESKKQWMEDINDFSKKEKRVTILGSSSRMLFLKNIKISLIDRGFRGIIIEQLPHFMYETPRQKVHSSLSNSKFVIADNCEPSGELLELEYCKNSGVVTAMITKKGERLASWMSIDFHIHSKDFCIFDYEKEDLESVRKFVDEIISWVNKRCLERENDLNEVKKKYGYGS